MKLLLKFLVVSLISCFSGQLFAQALEWHQQHPIPTGIKINQIIEPSQGKIWLICDGGVILQSLNGGNGFSSINAPAGGYNLRAAAVLGQDSVAVCGEALQIWLTTDGGFSWSSKNNNLNNADVLTSIAFNELNQGLATGFLGTNLTSNNSGNSWATGATLTNWTLQGLHWQNHSTVWCGGANRTVFKSTNSGNSWQMAYQATAPTLNEIKGFVSLNDTLLAYGDVGFVKALSGTGLNLATNYNSGLGLCSIIYGFVTDSSFVFVAANGAVSFLHKDSLSNGAFTQVQLPQNFSATCAFSSSFGKVFLAGPNGFLAVLDSGIYKPWRVITQNVSSQDLRNVVFLNSQVGYACGNNETILKTTNGGQTWTLSRTGGNQLLRGLDLPNDSTIVAVGYSGRVWISNNSGASWQSSNIGTVNNLTFARCKGNVWWIGGFGGTLYRSTNSGNTWQMVAVPVQQTLTDLAQWNDTLIISGTRGTILRSLDGGQTWNQMVTGIRNHLMSIAYVDAQNAYAAGWDATIMKSTDGGISWNSQVLPQNQGDYWSVRFTSPTLGWVMGNLGITNRTQDGGQTWQPVYTANTQDIYGAYFLDQNNGWAVGKAGTILKFTASPLAIDKAILKRNNQSLWVNKKTGQLKSTAFIQPEAEIKILDVLGRVVYSALWKTGPELPQSLLQLSEIFNYQLHEPNGLSQKGLLQFGE